MKRLLVLGLLLVASAPRAQDFDELDQEAKNTPDADDPRAMLRAQAEDAEALSQAMQAQYDEYVRSLERQREELRALVRKQWDDFQESTPKTWVDYSKKGDAVSKVDFEKGKVVVETLVPVEQVKGDPAKAAKVGAEKLAEQAQKALAQKDAGGAPVLKDQIKDAQGKPVTAETAPRLIKETLAPKIQVDPKPVVAEDGKPRLKVRVEIPLVPDHLKIRADRQKTRIAEAANKYGLDPALVFAVVYTESEFNPLARSQAPAFGLMQLMPKTAAREAYQYLYKQDKILPPDYLYDPDHNILLGATYLHLLRSRHYSKVKNAENQRALMIAAYNCGPGCVRKYVLSKADPDALSHDALVGVIKRSAPRETAAYVPRVESRMAAYERVGSSRVDLQACKLEYSIVSPK